MLTYHVTEVELAALERKATGSIVRLVRYTRELRELLLALHPQVRRLDSQELHARFDSEVAAISMEELTH